MSKTSQCPKCEATLPPKGRFCLECGLDLYSEGIRRPPLHVIPIVIVALAVAGLIAYAVIKPTEPEAPPDIQEVSELTKEFLGLVARHEGERIVRRFYARDTERYEKTTQMLSEIIRHSGAPGLNVFRASVTDDYDEAQMFARKNNAQHPEYVAAVLAAITFSDGALNAGLGAKFGAERTNDFIAWYVGLVFRDADAKQATITSIGRHESDDGQRLLIASIGYPEPPTVIPGVASPTTIAWRQLPSGRWVLDLGSSEQYLLKEVLSMLLRVKL